MLFYEYLCQFNDAECDMSFAFNLLDLSIDNLAMSLKLILGLGLGLVGLANLVAFLLSLLLEVFGQEMTSRPRNAKSARGADAVLVSDSIASHGLLCVKTKS